MITEWFTALSQALYTISTFGVFLDPGFTFMAGVSVSTVLVFFPHILNTPNLT
jgi:hypothetical protein